MKKIFIFCLFCSSILFVNAQKQISVLTGTHSAGKNFITNTDIIAKEFIFPKNVYQFYLDTTHSWLTVQLRDLTMNKFPKATGKTVLYDLKNHSVKWVKNMNYNTANLLQYNDVIIKATSSASTRLNAETGKKKWQINRQLFFLDNYYDVGLAFWPLNSSAQMEGFKLSDGSLKWNRPVSSEYGINDIIHLNDSVLLFVAAGLHIIDTKYGFGWDYTAVTGSKDYTGTIAANAAGIFIGVLTGYYTIYSGYDLVSEICSGVWMENNEYYFASRDKITRLSSKGQPVWSTELPKKKTSKSDLFVQDTTVYMINYGYGIRGGQMVHFGIPYVAAFDQKNGKQLYMNELGENKERICDYITGNNMIICLYTDKIAGYGMPDGAVQFEKNMQPRLSDNFKSFVTDQFYVETDSGFYSIDITDPGNMHVLTDSLYVVTLNDQFEITETKDTRDLYTHFMATDKLKLLWRKEKMLVLNNENRKIAELNASLRSVLIGDKLYDMKGHNLVEFDLGELIKQRKEIMSSHYKNLNSKQTFDLIQQHLQDSSFVILDVRTPEEFQSGHIENAVLVDFKSPDFKQKIETLDRNKTYLVYCRRGGRSAAAVDIMNKLDFTNLYQLLNGIEGWTSDGYPVL